LRGYGTLGYVDSQPSRYVTQSPDTSEEIDRLLFERYRQMEPWEKFRMVAEMMETAEVFAFAGLRLRYPDASERELRLRYAAMRYDRETMIRAFGWDPGEP
jgi:hypothetical protein